MAAATYVFMPLFGLYYWYSTRGGFSNFTPVVRRPLRRELAVNGM